MSLAAAWERWWFRAADARSYAALRIGWGLLALWLYVPMWKDLGWALADPGVYPLSARAVDYGPERISVLANPWWSLGTLGEVQAFFAVFLATCVAVVVGLGGRLSFGLAWLGVVSMMNRTAVWTDGSDVVLKVFGFYLLFMPLTRVWSVDAAWRRGAPAAVAGWPLRLFQLQVCILYVRTGIVKAIDQRWQEGEAVYHALSTSYLWRFDLRGLLANPLFQGWTVVATYATLVFEIGFPLVLFARLRRPVLLAGLALHLGIASMMSLGGFSEAILWTYLAFVVFTPRPEEA